jgi:hypothetical protein
MICSCRVNRASDIITKPCHGPDTKMAWPEQIFALQKIETNPSRPNSEETPVSRYFERVISNALRFKLKKE